MSSNVIINDKVLYISDTDLYMLGILSSKVHMVWVKMISGRLKSDISYSPAVYNNFVWPSPSKKQKAKIESTAHADLYGFLTMPEGLLKAHKANDAAVCEAYGWPKDITEQDILIRLFNLYHEFTA